MGLVKRVLRGTPLYGIAKRLRAKRFARQWTIHDEEMFAFYSGFVAPGELVFDVGANVGNRTKIFLKIHAVVVAVEPQDECAKALEISFGKHKDLTVVRKVVGPSEGEAELMISSANVLSSVSDEWIKAVKSSGRFAHHSWENKTVVPMTTLDVLIRKYGMPSFVKIDVEGYEYEVLRGLSSPVKHMSFEFTPEYIESTRNCIQYLETLGDARFNYSMRESMKMALEQYVSGKEVLGVLSAYRGDNKLFGDVYCHFGDASTGRLP